MIYRNLADEGVDPDDDYCDWDTACPSCQGIGVLVVSQREHTIYCTECERDMTEAVIAQAKADAERDAWEGSPEGRKAQAAMDAAMDAAIADWYTDQMEESCQ